MPTCGTTPRQTLPQAASGMLYGAPASSLSSSTRLREARPPSDLIETIVGRSRAGNVIKVLESKHGSTQFEVWEVIDGRSIVLGKVSTLAQKDRAVYKAVCSKHRQCHCLINCLDSQKVLRWLQVAGDTTPQEHAELSREVRRSLGMRLRNATGDSQA